MPFLFVLKKYIYSRSSTPSMNICLRILDKLFKYAYKFRTFYVCTKQNNQTTTSNFPCNFNFTVSNMNRFNQGIDHG